MKILQETLREEFGKQHITKVELPKYFTTSLNPKMKLRPYQEECFKYFITYWQNDFDAKESKPHLLFHMATGSGKTLIMAGAMLYLYEQGYRNFLFFVNSTNIIEKTKDNFINSASPKYLFGETINISDKQVGIKLVDNFQAADKNCINLCLNTIQGLHSSLNTPKENAVTYDDFFEHKVVLISDEAHHTNTATKKGKNSTATNTGLKFTEDWESSVMKIFHSNEDNVLLEFTATEDFMDVNIADKYDNKVIFDYPLKKFREDRYSKDVAVIQSDLSPIERAIQCVLLSQYKRKLFSSIHQDIKPVILLKSRTIDENKKNHKEFINAIKQLNPNEIKHIASNAKGDMLDVFSYITEKEIELENLLLEIKEDFKEENLLLIDGNNISPDKQLKLNSLESKNNEVRVVFAVDMLNEGWDVLNLFDIVRLYDKRDAKSNKPGKTTMQEAQLIGRGARYMPFVAPDENLPVGSRKYDGDIKNRLRTLETLHYHSAYNPKYIQELHTALVETGIIPEKTKEIALTIKDNFKKSRLYTAGYVFTNEQDSYNINEDVISIGDHILTHTYIVKLHSGNTYTKKIFENESSTIGFSTKYVSIKLRDLGSHIIRAALNRFDKYKFNNLSIIFPNLKSIRDFIESKNYLGDLSIRIYGKETLSQLTAKEMLYVATEVLKQIEPLLKKGGISYRGTKHFIPKEFKTIFKDHILKISLDQSKEKEYGISMKETTNPELMLDLSKCDWHVYNDCYGTSEEKYMIKYIEAIYPQLKTKYSEVYLVRNEKDLKLWSFETGVAFEPDYILFLRTKDKNLFDNIQIFIEPKGNHLLKTDEWKEDCLKEINKIASIDFSLKSESFNIWGLPFFNNNKRINFENEFDENFL